MTQRDDPVDRHLRELRGEPTAEPSGDPFAAPAGGRYVDATSRIQAAGRMGLTDLYRALAEPELQKTVQQFIERRIRKLERVHGRQKI